MATKCWILVLSAIAYMHLGPVNCYGFSSFQSLFDMFGRSADPTESEAHERVKRQRSNGGDECTDAHLSCGGT